MCKHIPLLILCASTLRVSSYTLVPKGKVLGGVRGLAAAASPARDALKVRVFLGSSCVDGPPRPARVGVRVAAFVERALISRGHSVSIVDPVDFDILLLRKPHFSYERGKAPEVMEILAGLVASADCYVMVKRLRACFPKCDRSGRSFPQRVLAPVHEGPPSQVTPEHNHVVSSALMNTLNHFGSSLFSLRPFAIVSYSMGQVASGGGSIRMHPLAVEEYEYALWRWRLICS